MRPDRSSRGQRAKRARQPTLAGRTVPATAQAVNGHAAGKAVTFGPFRFLPAQRMLLEGDKPLPLGSRAFDILNLLLERPGEVIPKDEIIARVWPNIFVDETVVRTHIGALRKVLGDDKRANRYVSNVPGRGYVFVAPVSSEEPTRPPAAPVDKRAAIHNLPPPRARIRKPMRKRGRTKGLPRGKGCAQWRLDPQIVRLPARFKSVRHAAAPEKRAIPKQPIRR